MQIKGEDGDPNSFRVTIQFSFALLISFLLTINVIQSFHYHLEDEDVSQRVSIRV